MRLRRQMRQELTQRPWGQPAVDFLIDHERCALWAYMGSGKTPIVLTALDTMYLTGDLRRPTLVIGPKRVAEWTWTREAAKWSQFADMRIQPIMGDRDARRAAMRVDAQIFTVNYEQIPWLVEELRGRWPYQCVVADESPRLKSFRLSQGGQRAGILADVAHGSVDRWINLTGTPAPNGLKDLWGQTWFLDRGRRLGKSFSAFEQRWFRRKYMGYGLEILPHAEKEIRELLKDICLTVDPRDYMEIDEPIVIPVHVQLPVRARQAYKDMEKTLFAMLESGDSIEVFNEASLTNKCMQLANGFAYTDKKGTWSAVHDAKLEALESVVNEAGGAQLLVAYEFKADLARILRNFKGAVDISVKRGFDEFMSGKKQIGVAHPGSMGHGIDGLQERTNILVRYGHGWNLEYRLQMLERIGPMRQMQSGFKRPVFVYDLIAENTIDLAVIARSASKIATQDALTNYMKQRREADGQ